MMTRKDFVSFANALRLERINIEKDPDDGDVLSGFMTAVDVVANVCVDSNFSFNRKRFMAAIKKA